MNPATPFGALADGQLMRAEVLDALVRLPLAAVLGAALALRPRRRGTPVRQAAVVQTQIVLAIVGALIMLVVGASLARAFGIVGAANLIRYRSKVDDPKDAVVMLCTLAIGLASGVGLFGLALVGTVFVGVVLWIVEGFDPQTRLFEVCVKLGEQTQALRPRIEQVLRSAKARVELRSEAPAEVAYVATVPRDFDLDRVTTRLIGLGAGGGAVDWHEKKGKDNGMGDE